MTSQGSAIARRPSARTCAATPSTSRQRARAERDVRAGLGERERDARADAAPRAGDDGDLPVELEAIEDHARLEAQLSWGSWWRRRPRPRSVPAARSRTGARGAAPAPQLAARLPRRGLGLPGRTHRPDRRRSRRRRRRRPARRRTRGARGGGHQVDPDALVQISHWTTPEGLPKRFATWFFAGLADTAHGAVDGGEIHAHAWRTPAEALAARARARSSCRRPPSSRCPPWSRTRARRTRSLRCARPTPAIFLPRVVRIPGGACSLYPADVGWEDRDPERAGPRHRLVMLDNGWSYLREG